MIAARSTRPASTTSLPCSKYRNQTCYNCDKSLQLQRFVHWLESNLPLFENAALKVAMGNATELLKAQADHVVGTAAEDGFAEAMERFVLN